MKLEYRLSARVAESPDYLLEFDAQSDTFRDGRYKPIVRQATGNSEHNAIFGVGELSLGRSNVLSRSEVRTGAVLYFPLPLHSWCPSFYTLEDVNKYPTRARW